MTQLEFYYLFTSFIEIILLLIQGNLSSASDSRLTKIVQKVQCYGLNQLFNGLLPDRNQDQGANKAV